MKILQETFKKLFYNNNNIIVADTETSGLSKVVNEEITSPEITQFAGIEYQLQKNLEIKEENNSLVIKFNGYSKRFFNDYKKNDNKYILDNGDIIEIVNNIPILIKSNQKSLLFKDSLKLEEINQYNETYRINDNLDFQASAVTKIVNSEELLKLDDAKLSDFILINFNTIKDKIDKKLLLRWQEIINNNQENLSTFISTFIREFKYLDISAKDENDKYIYNTLNKEKIYNFLNKKIVGGHNFASFDYMNVLKGNGINPEIFIIDTMFFQKEVTKGNSLDINIIYYLEQELKKIKSKIIKNEDLTEKINTILTQLKAGRSSLNNDILNFDDYDQNDNEVLNREIKEIKSIIKLINDRRFAHDALLDVKLNKFVLDKKLNNYFNKHINEIEIIKETKIKLIKKELVEPIGIIGVETKDTKENLTTFDNINDYMLREEFENIVITDESPKNYYKLNEILTKSKIKNSLSFSLKYKNYKIKIILNDKKGLMLLSLMTSKFGNLVITDDHIKDLIKDSDCQLIFPIEAINESKKFKSNKIKVGINLLKLPKQGILENKYIKEKGIFVAGNKYGGNNKIVRDIIWHSVQQNEKIDQSLLVNFLHSDMIDLQEESLDKLTKEYLTTIYSAFPEIGKNSNNLLKELKTKEFIEPVIYDKKNIYFTPKKLGLTDKEFKDSNEYKEWSFNHTKENITFSKSIVPYITILQKYVKYRNHQLFTCSKENHNKLLEKNLKVYEKLLLEYNSNSIKTLKDKFEFIDFLLKNDKKFENFLKRGLEIYNDRVLTEMNVIFDMKDKGISNGNNLYTTRMIIKTMDNLLVKKDLNKLDKKFNFISKEKDKFFDDDYKKTISTILNADKKELEELYDNILIEQEKRTVGPGRGSAGGSLYTYLMDITNIEPLRFNLLFERFLNFERVSPPDIDADYPFSSDNKKGLSIEKFLNIIEKNNTFKIEEFHKLFEDIGLDKKYLEKYFSDYKMVKKLGTEAETTNKNLFRKLLSILKVPPLKVNEYSATYNEDLNLKENIKNIPELYNVYCLIKDIDIDILEEIPMNVGSAASAVMLNFISPVDNKGVISFTKNSDGDFDNKLDILSLATMKQILLMQNILIKNKKETFNYNLDDLNDKETLLTIQKGQTGVIFQMESSLMTNYLKSLYPLDYQAMADTTAIQRPGPLEWAAQPYLINRRLYFKNYFEKLIHLKYGNIKIDEKILKKFYRIFKDKNPYISFLTKEGKREYMLSYDQLKTIMDTKPFLETPEFTKIAGLHVQNLLSTEIDKIKSPEDLDIIIDEYKDKNGDLSSVEEIYLKYLETELIDFLNNNEVSSDTNIFRKIHKIALSKTVNELRKFEEKLSSHKIFKEITDKTYNTLVYQEDIMQLVQKAGGFTLGAADILRRAISKKKYDLSTVKPQIIDNLSNQIINLTAGKYNFKKDKKNNLIFIDENNKEYILGDTYIKEENNNFSIVFTTNNIYLENLPKEIIEKLKNIKNISKELGKISNIKKIQNFSKMEATYLYDKMKSFAGYAFNKSHADAYTNITYMTSYLKTHYPNIFYNTILRIGNEKNAQNILRELNVYDRKLIIPTIKDIDLDNIEDIIFPISKIKSVNADIELAINYLKKQMNITNIVDIYRNLGKKYLNKTTLNNLFKFGFFNDMFDDLQEKQLSNNIEMIIKTLDRIERDNKNYFIELITDKLEEKEIKLNKTQIKSMVTKYLDYKKEVFIYNIEEERNKYFEFNVLEIPEVDNEKLEFIKEFENDYSELTNDYWKNQGLFKIDKKDFNTYFIDLISETITKKNKDLSKTEIDKKVNNEINKLNDFINDNNYYDDMEKQLIYVDMLKEYNYLKNIIRVIEVDTNTVKKEINNFQKEFKLLYTKKKKENDGIINPMLFNTHWIGNKPTTLILIPNYVRALNIKKFNGNVSLTPKIKINNKYTLFETRKLEKEKQYLTTQGRNVEQKAIQRLYTDGKYLDFVAQKNGIFYIGDEGETFINIDNDNKYKGVPLEKNKIADANGNITNKELAEELGIEQLDLIHEEFNAIQEDLIKNEIDLNTVVIMPSSAKIEKEKIDWVGNNNYLKLLTNFINNCNFKSVIPIGNEALKSIKSLNNINFAGFKTDYNYPYQFGEKLGYSIVTFVENRFVPNFDNKKDVKNKYYETLKAVLKKDIVIISDSNKFKKIHNVKKNKNIDINLK